jgi:hypothetical protein
MLEALPPFEQAASNLLQALRSATPAQAQAFRQGTPAQPQAPKPTAAQLQVLRKATPAQLKALRKATPEQIRAAANRQSQAAIKKLVHQRAAPLAQKIKRLAQSNVSPQEMRARSLKFMQDTPGGNVAMQAAREIASKGNLTPKTRAALQEAQKRFLKDPKVAKQFAQAAQPIKRAEAVFEQQVSKLAAGIPVPPGAKQALGQLLQGNVDVSTLQNLGTQGGKQLLERYGKQHGEKALRSLMSKVPNLKIPNVPGVSGVVNAIGGQLLSGNFSPKSLAKAAAAAGKKELVSQGKKLAIEYGVKAAKKIGGEAGKQLASKFVAAVPYVGAVASLATSGRSSPNLQGQCDYQQWTDVLGGDKARSGGYMPSIEYPCGKGLPDSRFKLTDTPKGDAWLRKHHSKQVPKNKKKAQELSAYKEKITGFAAEIRKKHPPGVEGLERAWREALSMAELWSDRKSRGQHGKKWQGYNKRGCGGSEGPPKSKCIPWTRDVFGNMVGGPPFTSREKTTDNATKYKLAATVLRKELELAKGTPAAPASTFNIGGPSCPANWATDENAPIECLRYVYRNVLWCEERERALEWAKLCNKKKLRGAIGMMVSAPLALVGGGPVLAAGIMAKNIGEQAADYAKAKRHPEKYKFT